MKKTILVLACFVLALLLLFLVHQFAGGGPAGESSAEHGDTAPAESTFSRRQAQGARARVQADMPWEKKKGGSEDKSSALRRQLKAAKVEFDPHPSAPAMEFFSATVEAEIAPGESLVTGGYEVGEGVYEFTFITPRKIDRDDGPEAVEMSVLILEAKSEFIAEARMESLATGERDTQQHAEAWQQEEMVATQKAAQEHGGVGFTTGPRVIALPGREATVEIVNEHGAGYSVQTTVSMTPEGGFAIQSRVQRSMVVAPEP